MTLTKKDLQEIMDRHEFVNHVVRDDMVRMEFTILASYSALSDALEAMKAGDVNSMAYALGHVLSVLPKV